ncbi:hypothetical protein PFLmoz3_05617 [Pseudomonas fluorescens]|uniref:Uncharacterized protein n=1 Tax=Pseudomonas fluorescens TaxID=294 RepID=A0A125QHH9_PSEFL|nr:hypothetical protein PFLmoz3_05617 [Pseudomonas fluorescens]
MGVTGSVTVRVSMRLPSRDQGRCTRSDRIATPLPLATMLRTASTELVRSRTLGVCPACSQ